MVAGQETHLALSLNQPYNGGTFEYGNNNINFNENIILTGGGKRRRRKRTNKKRRSTKRKMKRSKGKRTIKHSSNKRKTLASLRAQLKKYI